MCISINYDLKEKFIKRKIICSLIFFTNLNYILLYFYIIKS